MTPDFSRLGFDERALPPRIAESLSGTFLLGKSRPY